MKPGFGKFPITLHCRLMNIERLGGLLDAQSALEPQLVDAGFAPVSSLRTFHCIIKRNQARCPHNRRGVHIIQRQFDGLAASLFRMMSTRIIHQDSPHYFRGHGEKMIATLPVHTFLIDQSKKCLVHDRSGLQSVVAPFTTQCLLGNLV